MGELSSFLSLLRSRGLGHFIIILLDGGGFGNGLSHGPTEGDPLLPPPFVTVLFYLGLICK